MGHACSFRCALACFHSCLPLFVPVRRLCLFTVCICLSFAPVLTYWLHALLVIQSMGRMCLFRCAFVWAHARFHSCPLSFAPAVVCNHSYIPPVRTLSHLCSCSVPLFVCARARCCWL